MTLVLLTGVVACGGGGDPADPIVVVPVSTVVISPALREVAIGETVVLQAELKDASGNVLTDRSITWASSANSVATVSSSGLVAAVAQGQAIITATSGDKTGVATINVPFPVADVVIDAPEFVRIGQTVSINARAVSSTGATLQRPITYSTSNLAVLGVSGSGQVSGLAAGTATITATSDGRSKDVTMTATPVASVAVDYPNYYIPMEANVPIDLLATNQAGAAVIGLSTRVWSTSVASASVSPAGQLKANDFGVFTVTGRWDGQSATQELFALEPLFSNDPVSGFGSNVPEQQFGFALILPPPPSRLVLTIRGANGDADLILGRPSKTSASQVACAPLLDGSNEDCDMVDLPAGYYVVIVETFSPYSNLELKAVITSPAATVAASRIRRQNWRPTPLVRVIPTTPRNVHR